MEIYLDACCLNRPFDDQIQERIRLEAEAVMAILGRCQKGEWHLMGSEALDWEIFRTPDDDRRQRVLVLAGLARHRVPLDPVVVKRAYQLRLVLPDSRQ